MSFLKPNDSEMMRLIRARIELGYPMSAIAKEIGIEIDELCDWIMAYKEPRRPKPYHSKGGSPITTIKVAYPGSDAPSQNLTRDARRFANWRKSVEGARIARGEA